MQIQTQRPNRRPKLYLPLALTRRPAETGTAHSPLSSHQLKRAVAEMMD